MIWLLAACVEVEPYEGIAPEVVIDGIHATDMKAHVDFLADDASDGRIPGSEGHDEVFAYLHEQLEAIGLEPLGVDGGFEHTFDHRARQGHYWPVDGGARQSESTTGRNLVAVLPGGDPARADEYVALVAHYDHLGVSDDGTEVFNGAYDNAAAVAAVLEICDAIMNAEERPDRSLLILLTDSEEAGLQGAGRWLDTPTTSVDDVVTMISADPLGRGFLPDNAPLVLMGTEGNAALQAALQTTADLYQVPHARGAGVHFLPADTLEGFSSDHVPFLGRSIASTWMASPGMTWYHTVDDTAETIDYRVLRAQARWLAHALYALDDVTGRLDHNPPDAWRPEDFSALLGMVDTMLLSEELDDGQREHANNLREEVVTALEAGTTDAIDVETFRLSAGLLLFSAARDNPGPVPPPFPLDER